MEPAVVTVVNLVWTPVGRRGFFRLRRVVRRIYAEFLQFGAVQVR